MVGRQNHTIEALADRGDPEVHVLELVLLWELPNGGDQA